MIKSQPSPKCKPTLFSHISCQECNSHRNSVVGGQDFVRPDTAEVSLEESTGDSSQQQCTQNNTDRPASRQSANARNEEPPTPSPPTHNAPRGAASSTKAKGIWCDGCTERKSQKSDVGRSRQNAKWGCKDCARLKAEAGQSRNRQRSSTAGQARPETGNSQPALEKAEPSQPITPQIARRKWERKSKRKTPQADLLKQWMVPVALEQQQQQNGGFNPGTDSDDPDNLPKPVADNLLLDRFGQRKDHAESTRQIRENYLQANAQPPVAGNSKLDFYLDNDGPGVPAASPASRQSTVLPRSMTPSGTSIQIADERGRPPSQFEDSLRAMPNHPHMTYAPSPVPVTASGPQQQQHGERPVEYAPHPGFLGTPSRRNEFQGNADIASFPQYPDPTEFEMSRRPTYFDDAMKDMEWPMAHEALHQSQWQSTGVPGSHDIARNDANFPSNYGASSSSAQFDFSSTLGRMNPQPADPSGYQRHPGLRPESRDRMLSGALRRPAAPQVPATLLVPSGLGATNNSQNNVDPGEVEAGRAMFDQYIN